LSTGTISKAKTTMGGMSRTMKETKDIERAKDTVEANRQKLDQLEADFKTDMDALAEKTDPSTEELERIAVRPAKKDISLQFIALGWFPYWKNRDGVLEPAW
ncbi:MAG: ATP-binding protein, partial [Dehalococcoidales bacterium]|nr:ATP-binding protein [Dehalococcoidales bacterium]